MDPHEEPVDPRRQLGWRDIGVSTINVLRHARLPLHLVSRKSPTVTGHEYLRLWARLSASAPTHLLVVADTQFGRDWYVAALDAFMSGQYGTSVVLQLLGCRWGSAR